MATNAERSSSDGRRVTAQPGEPGPAGSRRRWGLAVFTAVFALNLLSSSREPAWGDGHGMWEVAERLVSHGAIDIATRWPEDIPAGSGGKYYGIAPIGPSLIHLPGAAIAGLSHAVAPSCDRLVRPLATHLAPAALGALACLVFLALLGDLGIGRRTATLATAIVACATTTWVYARYPYSEILQLVGFLGLFRQVLLACEQPVRRSALWLGAWAGALFNAKYVFAVAIAGGLAVVAWTLRHRRAELVRVLGWAALAAIPLAALALLYNWARWGSIARTGYEPYLGAYFGGSVFDGAWGMLLSPNKSAVLYSPPLVLALAGLPAALRARPRLGLAMLAMGVPVFAIYCTYRSWSGDYAWGPRFLVWATPVAMIPIAWWLDAAATRLRRAITIAVVALGIAVQLLGNALYWDHFIRIAIDGKNQWLGQPDRSGAYVAARGRGHCDSCFEDTYELLWLPAFQPIRGHWWLVESIARGDSAEQAQRDAPWRTYTALNFDLSASYPRARIDWWGLLWLRDAPGTWPLGAALAIALVAGLAWPLWWLRRHWRQVGRAP
jgi:hypothetical protein